MLCICIKNTLYIKMIFYIKVMVSISCLTTNILRSKGLQGRCLYPMTKQPIRLHSIVIGSCETCVDETSQISELRQSLCLNDKEESPNKKRRSDSIDDSWNLEYCPKLERVADFRVDAFLRTDDRRACPNAIAYYKQVDGKNIISKVVL